jgi:hypothetical protein
LEKLRKDKEDQALDGCTFKPLRPGQFTNPKPSNSASRNTLVKGKGMINDPSGLTFMNQEQSA